MYTLDEIKNRILQGDSLTILKTLPSESVDCVITSPPYWALRDYKVDGQIGNEKTIDEYITNLINIFNECKRILKMEGTCWVVLGDTYSGNTKAGNKVFGNPEFNKNRPSRALTLTPEKKTDLQDKSLCLIPERFALKMIENKWILRNKIIWYKRNCMPSSAKDRFTIDYEYVYFFTKSKKYYFKTQYEPLQEDTITRNEKKAKGIQKVWTFGGTKKYKDFYFNATYSGNAYIPNGKGRIKRSVWTINPRPFLEAHFAVFPEQLVKQCLDAGCPSGGVTLDPFMGSGTVALVALKNAMNFVGIELNPEYIKIAEKRIEPYLKQEKLTQFTR